MKFIVSSSELLKHLQAISGVLASNNTLPILDNFLFELDVDALSISASDLETTMITRFPVKSEKQGAIAVPARLLIDYLKTLPDQPLTFTIDDRSLLIEISSSFGKSKLAGFNANEFPKNPEMEEPSSAMVSPGLLAEAIQKTIFAAGNDDLRPVMSGIYCEFSADELRFVSTDAHKLVRYTRKDGQAKGNSTFIVPKKPLNLMKGLLASTVADVSVEFDKTNIKLSFGDRSKQSIPSFLTEVLFFTAR